MVHMIGINTFLNLVTPRFLLKESLISIDVISSHNILSVQLNVKSNFGDIVGINTIKELINKMIESLLSNFISNKRVPIIGDNAIKNISLCITVAAFILPNIQI